MPVTLDETVGGPNANTYVTVQEGAELALLRPNASWWGDATDERRRAMLVAAARLMQGYPWPGRRATTTQALAFPRVDLRMKDHPVLGMWPSDIIPPPAKEVQVDIALALLGPYASEMYGADQLPQVILKKTDVLETRWAEADVGPRGLARYPFLMAALSELLSPGTDLSVTRIVRT